jgi:hypothetical protein
MWIIKLLERNYMDFSWRNKINGRGMDQRLNRSKNPFLNPSGPEITTNLIPNQDYDIPPHLHHHPSIIIKMLTIK